MGDCPVSDLRSLLKALHIDLNKVTSSSDSTENRSFPDVDLPAIAARKSSVPKKFAKGDLLKLQKVVSSMNASVDDDNDDEDGGVAAGSEGGGSGEGEESAAGNGDDDDSAMNDEMLEVTPEVQMFFGNHFLATENGGAAGADDDEEEGTSGVAAEGDDDAADTTPNSSMMEQTMARHKEMMMRNGAMYDNGEDFDGARTYGGGGGGGGGRPAGSSSSASGNGEYVCRLCGKASGNGASLFAHLLYPHYAHLWRQDVPHRAARYDCQQCNYTTVKRQHYVMHVARVHDELRKKLAALGENLAVLDNLTQKHQTSGSNERIVSKIAKGIMDHDASAASAHMAAGSHDENSTDVPAGSSGGGGNGATDSPSGREGGGGGIEDYTSSPSGAGFGQQHQQQPPPPKFGGGYDYVPQSRFPRGFKPFVKCRMCGKSWKGKDNFFTHLVSTHFKYLWAAEVPRQADMFYCHVPGCTYQSKYRYNFLFHLAGKHKQLKQKLAEEGIPADVLVPIEMDSAEMEAEQAEQMSASMAAAGMMGSPAAAAAASQFKYSKLLKQQQQQYQQQRLMTTPPSAVKGSHSPQAGGSGGTGPSKPSQNNTRLICRVCQKVSLNHTCHRQHVVGKHFQEFWSHLAPDGMGIFNCHHIDCTYKTPNRSVFVIHLAYVHQELKTKLINSGRDPSCATPDVFGKRKYRRAYYDNTQHLSGMDFSGNAAMAAAAAAAAAAATSSGGGAGASAEMPSNPAEAMASLMMTMMGGGKNLNTSQQEALKQLFAGGAGPGSGAGGDDAEEGGNGGGGGGGNGAADMSVSEPKEDAQMEEGVDPSSAHHAAATHHGSMSHQGYDASMAHAGGSGMMGAHPAASANGYEMDDMQMAGAGGMLG